MIKKLVILLVTVFIVAGCKQKDLVANPGDPGQQPTPPSGSITITPDVTTIINSANPVVFTAVLTGTTQPTYTLHLSNDTTVTPGSINPDGTQFLVSPIKNATKGQTVEVYAVDGSTPPIKSNTVTLTIDYQLP